MADPVEKNEEAEVEGTPTPEATTQAETPTEPELDHELSLGEDEISDMLDLDLSDDVSEEEVEGESAAEVSEEEPSEEPAPAEEPEAKPEEVQDDPEEVKPPEEVKEEQPSREEQNAKWLDELQDSYQLSTEEADLMVTEPETVVPKLAAMIHQRVVTETLQNMAQLLPQLMQQTFQAQPDMLTQTMSVAQQRQEAETKFFTAFPALKGHEKETAAMVKMVKQAPENAGISQEDLITKAGMATMALLGLTAAPAPQETPPPANKPFTPAQPGGASGNLPASSQQSEWEELLDPELM